LGRVLGVDLGTRRMGLALSDPLRIISSPLETVPVKSESSVAATIVQVCRDRDVDLVVVGFPLQADGTEGEGCARSRRIAARLEASGMHVELHDESWSSRDAEEMLRSTGKTRKSAKEKVDAIAASLILRDYLQEASANPRR